MPVDPDVGAVGRAAPDVGRRRQRVLQVAEQPEHRHAVFVAARVEVPQAEGELVLLDVLVGAAAQVVAGGGIGVRLVLRAGEGARVLRLGVVGQTQAHRRHGRAADHPVPAGVELAELRGAVLAEPIGLELRDREGAAHVARAARGPALPLVEAVARPLAVSALDPHPLGERPRRPRAGSGMR